MSARILVLEDDESLRLVITKALARAGHEVRATASAQSAVERTARGEADLLIADVVLGQENFLDRIEEVTRARPDLPVIVISAQTTAATAIHAARGGARRYLPKPFDLDDLAAAVEEALAGEARPRRGPSAGHGGYAGLIGRSRAMQTVFQAIGRLSRNRLPVLLTGPDGSGRAAAARALHAARGGTHLLEGGPARLKESGLSFFEAGADGFLLRRAERWDEAARACVLEVLESGRDISVYATFDPGSGTELETLLHDRLARAQIAVPPLHERENDAVLLFEHTLEKLGSSRELGEPARELLSRWPFPGEVAELERAASAIATGVNRSEVKAEELRAALTRSQGAQANFSVLLERLAAQRFAHGGEGAGREIQNVADAALIRAAMACSGGVRRDAAALLGWNRNTLARRIEALGLDV